MKQALLINTHSFVDVITNSSTELFVCDTDKTVDAIKDILKGIGADSLVNIGIIGKGEKPYWMNDDDWGIKTKEGQIYIEGIEDNIIPYELFDCIEYLFNATRYHLG